MRRSIPPPCLYSRVHSQMCHILIDVWPSRFRMSVQSLTIEGCSHSHSRLLSWSCKHMRWFCDITISLEANLRSNMQLLKGSLNMLILTAILLAWRRISTFPKMSNCSFKLAAEKQTGTQRVQRNLSNEIIVMLCSSKMELWIKAQNYMNT